jgi:hypothetical protein
MRLLADAARAKHDEKKNDETSKTSGTGNTCATAPTRSPVNVKAVGRILL